MDDWDDIRWFLAVAEHGSTLAAARASRVSQSTIFRRIAALEAALGLSLFERRSSGYTLTEDGAALLPIAAQIAANVEHLSRVAAERQRSVAGTVRLSAPEIVLAHVLPPVIGRFRALYPAVKLELVATDRRVDLASGEADVALRGGLAPTDPSLFGRRLTYDRSVVAASRAYADAAGLPQSLADLRDHPLIRFDPPGAPTPLLDQLVACFPDEAVVLRPNTMTAVVAAVRGGLGLGILPRFVVDREADLVHAPIVLPLPVFELWIITHERRRHSAPVRALMDFVAAYVLAEQPQADE
ncbi:LysR family transcriptional regulator [Sphingomonas sp. RHCKR7]|uniref:LysR family transcriptional regulator n=1 Tax=Sphingomonas folli TaxID=2862497 RepID=UPI001C68648D|nr:LysR family transcriptional regulator [Sphingomonas folli]MBW6528961.1 LysR family transcriptional regulator [Sphingomonas folli]